MTHSASSFQPSDNATSQHATTVVNRLFKVFNLREHVSQERADIQNFIRQCFFSAHGAHITHFMPRLFSLCAAQGELIAAFGMRPAVDSPLFLENYLQQPIEQVLQQHFPDPVQRDEIVEIGNLSALYPGAARWLIVAITAMLQSEGYKWVVFTGTSSLKNGFHRLGLHPVELAAATLEHLPAQDRAAWGDYYSKAPMVMAGNIEYGYRTLLMHGNLPYLLRAGIDVVGEIV